MNGHSQGCDPNRSFRVIKKKETFGTSDGRRMKKRVEIYLFIFFIYHLHGWKIYSNRRFLFRKLNDRRGRQSARKAIKIGTVRNRR